MTQREVERVFLRMVAKGTLTIKSNGTIWRDGRRAEITHTGGKLMLNARVQGRRIKMYAHRLVYLARKGPIPEGKIVTQLNGRKDDNSPRNLKAMTVSEAFRHQFDHLGRRGPCPGQANGHAKLTDEIVRRIRQERAAGRSAAKIARKRKLHIDTIFKVLRGDRWSHVK